jgi:transposase
MGNVVVGVECMHCWYWVSDFCQTHEVDFVLGHALYMKAIYGGKAKNDKIDSYKIASLLKGGNFPLAYNYPKQMRATRDLLRRRTGVVRHGTSLKAHVVNTDVFQASCRLKFKFMPPCSLLPLISLFQG